MATVYPFTYATLKNSINGRIHGKMGLVTNPRQVINDSVNEVSGLYLRTAKRRAVLAPNLFNDIYQYAAPSDIDGNKLIGIQPQSMNRSRSNIWELVTEEEFDIRKQSETNLVAFSDHTFVRGILISSRNGSLKELSIAGIQNITGDGSGSWTAFGNASNLVQDTYNFIKGSGSVQFDLTAGGTTSGIVNTTLSTFDLTYYKTAGSVFAWAYFTTAANVTNVKLRLGNNSGNYYELTATTPNDGTVFANGWNLIRFDFNGKTTTGSPVDTTCAYAAIFLTKASGTAETSYRFNWLNAKQGIISNLIYYSDNPWESAVGVYQANSILDSDYLVCDQDEYNLFVEKGVEKCGNAAREYQDAKDAKENYGDVMKHTGMSYSYKQSYPTEALQLTSTYAYVNSRAVVGGALDDNSGILLR